MSGKNTTRSGWLKNPQLPRAGEKIGGGYFVFRRGDGTKRVRPSQWPFEYDTRAAAEEQANILAADQPGYQFDVLAVVSSFAHVPALTVSSPLSGEKT